MVPAGNIPGGWRQRSFAARWPFHGSSGEGIQIVVCMENKVSPKQISDDFTVGRCIGRSESQGCCTVCFGTIHVWQAKEEVIWMVNLSWSVKHARLSYGFMKTFGKIATPGKLKLLDLKVYFMESNSRVLVDNLDSQIVQIPMFSLFAVETRWKFSISAGCKFRSQPRLRNGWFVVRNTLLLFNKNIIYNKIEAEISEILRICKKVPLAENFSKCIFSC